jgi:hypothetical protein
MDRISCAPKVTNADESEVFFSNHTIPRIRIQRNKMPSRLRKFREYVKATVIEEQHVADVESISGADGTFQESMAGHL